MRKYTLVIMALLLIPLLGAQVAPNTASIAGITRNEIGAPVQASLTAISGAFIQRALAATNGTFQFNQLRAGAYVICGVELPAAVTTGPDDQALNSCLWLDSTYSKFTVAAGQALSGVAVTLKRGRRLTIRVNDPAKLLPAKVGQHSGNEMALRIAGPSAIVHRIPIVAEDAAGRTHALVIPYNQPHKLSIQSSAFTLSGQNLAIAAVPVNVQFAHGDPEKILVVNVLAKVGK
ncbi:MAG: hypothetical protein ACR2NN_04075 [Bryobacteraceae bacterium]